MSGHVAAYLRVSSRSQDLATQRHSIEVASATRGEPVYEWFTEHKSGRSLKDRPALTELRRAVRAGRIRLLFVYRLDRLGRSGIRDTFTLVDEFARAGCRIVNLSDPFSLDAPGPFQELIIAVLAWCAQQERVAIGDRISDARKRMDHEGKTWGRPRRVDPGTVEKCRILRESGKSIRIISAELKIPRSTVALVLSEKGHYKPPPSKP
jgi:site-specific DNA recombinase